MFIKNKMTQLSYGELNAQSVPKARLEEATLPQTQFLQWYRIQILQRIRESPLPQQTDFRSLYCKNERL